ncbi:hypothetical protein GOODEAATRI_018844, partial [Goodea atripinnis]
IIEPEALKQGNMSSLGFTSKEQRNLGLLVHLMTTNPKILYSPIGSQVDKVIQKLSSELQQQPELLNGTDSELMQALMMGNYTFPNTSTLLEQLETIDNAACGWTRFMSKVSRMWNIWSGC